MINFISEKDQEKFELRENFYLSIGMDRLAMRKKIASLVLPESDLLEIGTGKGRLTKLLAQRAASVVSVDISETEQNYAKFNLEFSELKEKVKFVLADAEKLPFADNSYAVVVSAYTFHHLHNPFVVIDEMLRVCSDKLILVEFNKEGFAAVDKTHQLEGGNHEQNGINFLEVGKYLEQKQLLVEYTADEWQDIYVIYK